MPKNTKKLTQEYLCILINILTKLKFSLKPELHIIIFIYIKLVTACQNVPACKFAIYNPPVDIKKLINKLILLISAYKKEQEQKQQ
jgi:hypothetical protein